MASDKIAIINIHTASSSLALNHSITTEPLTVLFNKLSRKRNTEFYGKPVGPGWLKYEWNGSFCNLYDDEDYKIFQWRQTESLDPPTVYLNDPSEPLPSYQNPCFYLFHPDHTLISSCTSGPEVQLDIKAIDSKINEELNLIRGGIKAFLKNPEPRTWEPPNFVSPDNQKFLTNLRIPCYHNGNPSLLLHNLDVCNDKEIEMIFGCSEHQFICNTSGSGKTRRLLEGLTKYWGFYLVASVGVTGVGVRDLQEVLDEFPLDTEWVSDLRTVDKGKRAVQQAVNSRIVSKHLRKVLAARIVVFQFFLQLAIEVDGKLLEKHKHIWLLFQLSDEALPHSGKRHPFLRIISCLRRASDEALDALVKRLYSIRHKFLSDSRFVLGLDEAQQALRMYPHSFISSTNPDIFQSIIREVFKVTTRLPIKLVVSGSRLSLAEVEDTMASRVSKRAAVHLFHKLGMFDTLPKLKSFLERYIPASILESESGKCLQQRMQEYLQGRYRFSVSFVEYFLRNGLQSPHKLLNELLKDYISCLPGDTGEPFTSDEDNLQIKVSTVGFDEWDRLKSDSSAITEAVQIVQSHLLKGQSPTYGPVTERLVEYGIARLCVEYGKHKGQIVEPLAFLSIMRWLQTQNYLNLQANLRLRLGHESARGSALEEVGILYLLRALRGGVCFSSVFDFQCTPSWANEMAHIVAHLDNVDVDVDVIGEARKNLGLSVVQFAGNIDDIMDWIDKDTASAILVPSDQFGPDIMARCHSSPSNETVLLMGQFKSYTVGNKASLAAKTTAEALTSLHPNHWFTQAPSHQRRKLINAIKKQRVLRFVGGYPPPPNLNSNAKSVQRAIEALGADVALASFRLDKFRANFIPEFEANFLSQMDDALDRKRKLTADTDGKKNIVGSLVCP